MIYDSRDNREEYIILHVIPSDRTISNIIFVILLRAVRSSLYIGFIFINAGEIRARVELILSVRARPCARVSERLYAVYPYYLVGCISDSFMMAAISILEIDRLQQRDKDFYLLSKCRDLRAQKSEHLMINI